MVWLNYRGPKTLILLIKKIKQYIGWMINIHYFNIKIWGKFNNENMGYKTPEISPSFYFA